MNKVTIAIKRMEINFLREATSNMLRTSCRAKENQMNKIAEKKRSEIINGIDNFLDTSYEELIRLKNESNEINKQIKKINDELRKKGYNQPSVGDLKTLKTFKRAIINGYKLLKDCKEYDELKEQNDKLYYFGRLLDRIVDTDVYLKMLSDNGIEVIVSEPEEQPILNIASIL